jgi:hypothetical protein
MANKKKKVAATPKTHNDKYAATDKKKVVKKKTK